MLDTVCIFVDSNVIVKFSLIYQFFIERYIKPKMSQSMSTSVSSSSENTGSTPIHKLPKMGSNTFGPPGTQSQSHSNSSSTPMHQQVQH